MADVTSILYETIGFRISEIRKLNNHNQQELADLIDISRSSVSNIESGRQQISLHLLYRISQVYGLEVHLLIPKASEITVKASMDINNINDIIRNQQVGNLTKNQIFELLK